MEMLIICVIGIVNVNISSFTLAQKVCLKLYMQNITLDTNVG